jgi:hypothetical protein
MEQEMAEKEKDEVLDDKDLEIFENFEEVLAAEDAEYRTIKAWGGKHARIGSLTAGQLITFLENNENPEKKRTNGMLLIALSLVDKKGKRLVNTIDETAVQTAIHQLHTRDASINGNVVEKILLLNGLNKKDAKEIAKNVSGEAPSGASPTA